MAHLSEPAVFVDWTVRPAERTVSNSTPVLDKNGNPAVGRRVRAFREDNGVCIAATQTDASGNYTLRMCCEGPVSVVIDGEPDRNALIQRGVMPA